MRSGSYWTVVVSEDEVAIRQTKVKIGVGVGGTGRKKCDCSVSGCL